MRKLFRTFCEEHPRVVNDELKSKIYTTRNAVKLEDKFIDLAYNSSEIQGLSKEDETYIRHIADRRLLQLGMKTKFKQKDNPLPWLDWVLNASL